MITAIDTNILLDVLLQDKKHFFHSKNLLEQYLPKGQLIISEVVYSELVCQFKISRDLKEFLTDTSIKLVYQNETSLAIAGERWKLYSRKRKNKLQCSSCGKFLVVQCEKCNSSILSRQHMISDFLIGSHALNNADLLLSRDRGFYETYFKDLKTLY